MIDWKPIKDVPTIDIYNFSAPIPHILLFHPSINAEWSAKRKEGYVLGYAYLAHDGRKIVCASGWSNDLTAECTHWAHLEPPKKKTPSTKRPSMDEWPKEFKKIMRKAVLG